MATYKVFTAGLSLSTFQKYAIAQAITKIHAEVTGAELNDCFIGGVLLDEPHVFLSGHIRSGRSEQTIKQLLVEIEIALQTTTKLPGHQIWAYIDDINPAHMIEYGQILPAVGDDKVWFSTLPASIQKKLNFLNS
jgi:hypothetical protein